MWNWITNSKEGRLKASNLGEEEPAWAAFCFSADSTKLLQPGQTVLQSHVSA